MSEPQFMYGTKVRARREHGNGELAGAEGKVLGVEGVHLIVEFPPAEFPFIVTKSDVEVIA
jgi:hypothetical protein